MFLNVFPEGKAFAVYKLATVAKYIDVHFAVTVQRSLSLQCDVWQPWFSVAVISVCWHIAFTCRLLTLGGGGKLVFKEH